MGKRYIDLSAEVDNETGVPPPSPLKVEITTGYREPAHWQGSWMSVSTHVGTHVDSPLHVVAGAPTIGRIPIERTIGEAVVLDLTPIEANEAIGPEHLEPHRAKVREGDIAILRTDWCDRMWKKPEYWLDSPYLTKEGAEWLAEQKPKACAFDFFQEYVGRFKEFNTRDFVVHDTLLPKGILLIENVTNLGALTQDRFMLYAVPIRLMTTEGAPARVYAVEED